jgi:hypothetical protein
MGATSGEDFSAEMAKWRGAVNTTRTFLIALEADPMLLAEFVSMR